MKYLIASNRSFEGCTITTPEELVKLPKNGTKRIYFPFWSWKIPKETLDRFECIGFHASPLPFGKGGSPIQNMIRLGYRDTEVCAFRITEKFDDGEVLLRGAASLEGSLDLIVNRMTGLISLMIENLEKPNFKPVTTGPNSKFVGIPSHFNRIVNNCLPEKETLKEIYDEIRMRDEVGHPKAKRYHGRFTIEFTDAKLRGNKVIAKVKFQ